jgi:hypothetical protein
MIIKGSEICEISKGTVGGCLYGVGTFQDQTLFLVHVFVVVVVVEIV